MTTSHLLEILKYFKFDHLPPYLQIISEPFGKLADKMVARCADEETSVEETLAGLRKLLEAKDCAVRAIIN